MIILFPRHKGVKIATTIIFRAMMDGAGFHYILGMIDFARKFGAITSKEEASILEHLNEEYRLRERGLQ